MKPRYVVTALVVLALAVLIWRPWRSRFGYHFSFPLPPTAKLVNYHHSGGLDAGDEFEFAVTDDALRDAIIEEWKLKPAAGDDDVRSFAKKAVRRGGRERSSTRFRNGTGGWTKPPRATGACGSIARTARCTRNTETGEGGEPQWPGRGRVHG